MVGSVLSAVHADTVIVLVVRTAQRALELIAWFFFGAFAHTLTSSSCSEHPDAKIVSF
jgi:hypothetical protein